jgi:hypothetical protein
LILLFGEAKPLALRPSGHCTIVDADCKVIGHSPASNGHAVVLSGGNLEVALKLLTVFVTESCDISR